MTQQVINVGAVANDGTGESLRTAFEAVNNNFSQIWSSGPVNSNIVIANNVISTTPVNTQLILAPGGIGNVQSNAHIVPGVSGVYDLGSSTRRWDSTYSDYFYGNGYFLTGIQVANVGSIVNGNSNIVINGPGGIVTVSVNGVPNIATVTTQGMSVAGNVIASGNITGNYLFGDGSFLTNIVASGGSSIDNGNSNVRIGADAANVTVSVSGVGNVAVFSPTGLQVSNTVTANTISVLGNVVAARFTGNGATLSSIAGANVTGNVPKATYAYTAAQAGLAYVANTVTEAAQPAITSVGTLTRLTVLGNIVGQANIVSSANVFGNYFIGNGRHLTGVLSTGTKSIENGTSNINITVANGPITVAVGNVANTAVFTSSATNFNTNVNVSGNITTGGILTDNYYYANGQPLDTQNPGGANTQIQFNDNGNFGASANLTFDSNTSILSINGNVDAVNINTTGGISAVGNVIANDGFAVGSKQIFDSAGTILNTSANILYVSSNGNDSNNGSLNAPFRSIKAAMTAAMLGNYSVHVGPGTYTEDNPVTIPANVALMGDNLRNVRVVPANPASDLFYVKNASYVWGITIANYTANGFAYDPATPTQNVFVSPYIQNITSSTTTGTAVYVDGNAVSAASTKAMIVGFFTIINRGGKGIHMVNSSYSQLVNIYTIACDIGVKVESGSFCTLNGSDCSIGNYGLWADGKGPLQTSGTLVSQFRGAFVIENLTNGQPNVNTVLSVDGDPNYYSIDTILPDTPLAGLTTVVIQNVYNNTPGAGTEISFYGRSAIIASAHTFEYVGAGTNPATALPQYGGIPRPENEILQTNGGVVTFTSTDQKGNFKVGTGFTINQATGVITGDYFYESLFAQMTPYILALSL